MGGLEEIGHHNIDMNRMMKISTLVAVLAICACAADIEHPWKAEFSPPTELAHGKFITPIKGEHAALDHAATIANREHLLKTLGWDYPEDYSVESSREDLLEYEYQFGNRSSYTYSIQTPDKSKVLGTIFMNRPDFGEPTEPVPEEANKEWPAAGRSIEVSLWLEKESTEAGLDKQLLSAFTSWLDAKWPVDAAMFTAGANNTKLHGICESLGFRQHQIHDIDEDMKEDLPPQDKTYVWLKPGFTVDLKTLPAVEYPEPAEEDVDSAEEMDEEHGGDEEGADEEAEDEGEGEGEDEDSAFEGDAEHEELGEMPDEEPIEDEPEQSAEDL